MLTATLLDNYTTDELVRYYSTESNDEHVRRLCKRIEDEVTERAADRAEEISDLETDRDYWKDQAEDHESDAMKLGTALDNIAQIFTDASATEDRSKLQKIRAILEANGYITKEAA